MYKISVALERVSSFDETPFKFIILYMNKIQKCIEFSFPDSEFDEYEYHAHLVITDAKLEGNYFFISEERRSTITTNAWELLFSPPSLFEYLIHCMITSSIHILSNHNIRSHSDTRGCQLDFTREKADDRVDIALGHFCVQHKKEIAEELGEEFLDAISKLACLDWIGLKTDETSLAFKMHHYFGMDLKFDSGLKKNWWQRASSKFTELPFEVLKEIIKLAGAIVLAWALIDLGLKVVK